MAEDNERSASSIWSLIWIPVVISLGMTLLRLTGELLHWSEMWFSTATGGVVPVVLLYVWAVMAVGAAVQFLAWPELARVMSAYGLAARIPVVVVMLLAMLGNWGTHYDYVGMPGPFQMPFWPGFFWLAFFPQLVFWVSYTIVLGVLSGSIAFASVRSSGGTD
jgi:hypothetical protein